uniref:DNA-(apurinic or apyrimidinic site) endonuclease 2 n=1 Tax=Epichloe sp. TaxID=1808013 RepID=A0A514CS44_9HYPO|nr:DNA lyase [Epichloe sp.]
MSAFRITTWNVNGIRNPFGYQPWREQRTFQSMFDILESDIVVMQETKIQRKDLQDDMVLVPGWDVFFSLPKYKKGYSGVAIYTRNATCAPLRAEEGVTGVLCAPRSTTSFRDLPSDQQIGGYPRPGQLSGAVEEAVLDSEGRCVILEFPAFVLLGVYCPANRDESRDVFRTSFFEALDVRIRNLVSMGKEVILAGDLNVIRSEMDSTNVLETLRKEDMTLEEWVSLPTRRVFNQLIFEGSIVGERDEERQEPVLWDLCRNFHPTRLGMNTCWDTKRNTRPANNGSRIDYILCSGGIKDWFTFANIQEGLMGSDHCPVFATIADRVSFKGNDTALLDVMNPPGVYAQGKRVRELAQRDLLPLSAKLIPEFDRRQSIRDMFFKKSSSIGVAADGAPSPGQPAKRASSITETGLRPVSSNNSNNNTDRNGTSEDLLGGASANSRAANAQQAESQKRQAEPIDPAPRQLKRSKSGADTNSSKLKTAPGQKTLKGFFKPVDSAAVHPTPSGLQESQTNNTSPRSATDSTSPTKSVSGEPVGSELTSPSPKYSQSNHSEPIPRLKERVFDPIEAKESWSKLLGKRVVPRCEHEEPCISLVTKKPGVNRGRSFYICPRPLGPSGEKEKGSEWRCGTFIWSSDWNGTAAS